MQLITERLILSPPTQGDHPDSCLLWSDPEVVRYIGGQTASASDVWARLLRYSGLWSLLGFGYWIVRHRQDGRFLGEVGLADFHRPLEPSIIGLAEAGWAFRPLAQGQGFAQEALSVGLEWFLAHHPDRPVVCIIDPDNQPSLRLAARLGFVLRGPACLSGRPTHLYQLQSGP